MPTKKAKQQEGKSRALRADSVNTLSLEGLLDKLPMGVFVVAEAEEGFRCRFANTWFEDLIDVHRPVIYGAKLSEILPTKAYQMFLHSFEQYCQNGHPYVFDWEMGSGPMARFLSCQILPVHEEGQLKQFVGVISDQSNAKLAEKQMLHNATHSELTGLPNRLLLEEMAESYLKEDEGECAILLLNVDRFQLINDSLGHITGDELLVALASRLGTLTPLGDALAHMGSDEFSILMKNISGLEDARQMAMSIHEAMAVPFKIANHELHLTISIGISTTLSSPKQAEDLIRDADFAMHRAKFSGKATSEVYLESDHSQARYRFQLETDLRHAINLEELELHYQPIFDLNTAALKGFEVLARWPHPEKGYISPADFIPIAEETGLIIPLGDWVLKQACKTLYEWRDVHPQQTDDIYLGVNLSPIQLAKDDCVETIKNVIETYKIPAGRLHLELTETAIVNNPQRALKALLRLKKLQVKLALDDFGTGYSSLSYLHKLPFDILKIDRSFVMELGQKQEAFAITQTITVLAQALNMSLIAEGIETEEQLKLLQKLGCSKGQGFLFAKPMPETQAHSLLLNYAKASGQT